MKPKFEMEDQVYKDQALSLLKNEHKVLALFDNEPANFPVFEKHFPESNLVFFHSTCSRAAAEPLAREIYKIESFQY